MLELTKLENTIWEPKVGADINDPPADSYHIVQTGHAMSLVMCSSNPYGGWLAKHVAKMYEQTEIFHFRFCLMIDDATLVCAQVMELDAKNTDAERYTYDFSSQINITKGWIFEVDNDAWTWVDSGIRLEPFEPYVDYAVEIEHLANYEKKQSAISAITVNGHRHDVPEIRWIPAKQVGWESSQVVLQLQQCNNSQAGAYTLRFRDISYVFVNEG